MTDGGVAQPWPGTFRPVPVVQLNGADVASTAGVTRFVLDGVSVTWGRERVLDQPGTATATVTLFDATGTTAASRQLIGQPVIIRWAETASGYPLQPVYFRGRVTATEVTRWNGGLLITLTCASVEADLANRIITGAAWPAETLAARRDRILAAASDLLSAISFPATWTPAAVGPATVDGISVLDLVTELYSSAGLRYTYAPDSNSFYSLDRRAYGNVYTLAGLETGRGRGNNAGATATDTVPSGAAGQQSHWIDGAALIDPDVSWSEDVATRINRVALSYPDSTAAYAIKTLTSSQAAGVGARTLTVTSVLSATASAQAAADAWLAAATSEGAHVVLPPFTLDTRLTDGFATQAQAVVWLAGQEIADLFVVSNSWLPGEGIRPVFGIMGGTIDYSDRGWLVTANPSPPYTGLSTYATPLPQANLTWEQTVDPAARTARPIKWTTARPTPAQWALDPALTCDDARWLGWGVGGSHSPATPAFDYAAYAAENRGLAP